MTTAELRKKENQEKFSINPSEYTKEELEAIDSILKIAENIQLLNFILKHRGIPEWPKAAD